MNSQSIISGLLHDELDRNLRMQQSYQKEIDNLPPGSIMKRKIGSNVYIYLKYREGSKTITKYIGKYIPSILEEMQQKINHRKYLQNILKQLKNEEKEILKAIK